MSIQSGSKLKNARPVASIPASPIAPASTVNEISLLERVSILASILLSLKQSVGSTAAVAQTAAAEATGEDGASSETGAAGELVISSAQAIEIARLPESLSTDSHSPARGSANPAGFTEHRLAAEAGADPIVPPLQADAVLKPIAHRGSSTSPSVLKIDVVDDKAGSAPLSLEKLVVATPVSDVIVSPIPKTTFVFTGTPGPDNFDIFVGTGRGNTIDLSQLTELGPPAKPQPAGAGDEVKQDRAAANGFLIDLAATKETVNTAAGPISVQVWKLDENGKATTAVAHLENIDNVVASIGNDIVKGNGNANTFTYTAADGSHDGQSASYGFDIYYGGPSDATGDLGDTADFSRLGTQASAAAAAPGSAPILLPHDAKGITVDLAQSVTIATVDPMTGETSTVTGSLVSTIGGAEQTDLALLAWSAAPAGSEAHATIEDIIGTGGSDVVRGDAADNTYVTVSGRKNGVSVFDGRGGNDTVDFSHVPPGAEAHAGAEVAAAAGVVPNGIYVNLASSEHSAESSVGEVTVQAWSIGANGAVDTALAHLEHVETVVGTVGSDVLVGNGEANTFVYSAADDASIDASGHISTGPEASYGFDIYHGGEAAGNATDLHDTADFSGLGSQESVAAALAEGEDSVLLPHDATGIMVDLGQAVSVSTVDPATGDLTTVAGSLVTTVGGSEDTDLALLAWTAPPDGSEGHSTIEDIVTSGGADAVWGDDAHNTVVVSGDGTNGPVYFDGRGSNDTIDFSRLELPDANSGIEVHLNQTTDGVTDPTGATQSDVTQVSLVSGQGGGSDDVTPVAQVRDVENVVGSCGNDIIEGDRNDNVMTGAGGSDTFVFSDVAVVDGRGITDIGHDIIRDFRRGGIDDDDHLVFDSKIFNFHDGSSLDWLQQLLNNNQIRDDDEGTIIWIDDNNSITLQNYDLDDYSGHGLGLAAYSSWIVFV
jgi:Ca2+-binding RTX toxin-like protein